MIPMSVLQVTNRSVRRVVSAVFAGDPSTASRSDWRLGEGDVELVASRRFGPGSVVAVMTVLCDWRLPSAGKCGTDFLEVWAVADDSVKPRSVVLHGGEVGPDGSLSWRDSGEFTRSAMADVDGRRVGIYRFCGPPVDEFVVRLTDQHGVTYYDSNGGYGDNYRLRRHQGLQTNCIRADVSVPNSQPGEGNWLVVFPRLVVLRAAGGVAQVSVD